MKFTTTSKSLNELYDIYGQGKNGFYSHWWADEPFADEKPEAGKYEIKLEKKQFENLTYDEQKKKLKKGYDFPHPAVLCEALLEYHKKTSKYLMTDWYSRTLAKGSSGSRVFVGYCDAEGVDVDDGCFDHPSGLGLAASRKLSKIEPRKVDTVII